MKKTLAIVIQAWLLTLCAKAQISGTDAWVNLFDGKTLNGWHSYGKQSAGKSWTIDGDAIRLISTDMKDGYQTHDGGDLVTNEEFENFELKLEWKIAKNGNSGIIFYIHEDPTRYKETWNTGIETQVLDIIGNEDSKSYKHDVGDLYDLISCNSHPARPYNEWNKVRIKCLNGHVEIYLNEIQIINVKLWDDNWKKLIATSKYKDMPNFGTFRKGRIALQDHGDEVWYRNIMIRKL